MPASCQILCAPYLFKSSGKLIQAFRNVLASLPRMWTISFPELSRQGTAGLRPAFAQTLAGLKWILYITEGIFPYVELRQRLLHKYSQRARCKQPPHSYTITMLLRNQQQYQRVFAYTIKTKLHQHKTYSYKDLCPAHWHWQTDTADFAHLFITNTCNSVTN